MHKTTYCVIGHYVLIQQFSCLSPRNPICRNCFVALMGRSNSDVNNTHQKDRMNLRQVAQSDPYKSIHHGEDEHGNGAEDVEVVAHHQEGQQPVASIGHVFPCQDVEGYDIKGQGHERPDNLNPTNNPKPISVCKS